jgi:hypothetical protein
LAALVSILPKSSSVLLIGVSQQQKNVVVTTIVNSPQGLNLLKLSPLFFLFTPQTPSAMRFALLSLLSLALCAEPAAAQITLEHTYGASAEEVVPFRTASGAVKYVAVPYLQPVATMLVYNDDHTLDRQIVVIPPAGVVTSVFYPSEALFDNDPSTIEMLVQYSDTVTYDFRAAIVSEQGAVLQDLGLVAPNGFMVIPTHSGAKLLVQASEVTPAKVYSLPGVYHSLRLTTGTDAEVAEGSAFRAWPNPTAGAIRLPYVLKSGTAPLIILDATGREVRRMTVGSAFSDVLLDTQSLPDGVYTYRVGAKTSRFVVAK